MTSLLARYADCIFWLARYMERAENLARILDVQETFARDSKGSHDWGLMLALHADTERFAQRHERPTAAAVLHFYVLDRDNPSSIVASLTQARENARALRPLISTEMWVQLNTFHHRVTTLSERDVGEERLARLSSMIKEGCDAHTGITAGTLYRDEAWCFYQLGAGIERADQTTRLLDAKFLGLQARGDATPPGSAADISYWTTLLRSVAAHQAFRRMHPHGMNPEQIASFVVCDPRFPRSVAHNLEVVEGALTTLRRRDHLRAAAGPLEHLDGLRDDIDVHKLRLVVAKGELHRFTDFIQGGLNELTRLISTGFFG